MQNVLQELGLTENEQTVYLGALSYPGRTGSRLAKLLNLDKSSTYRAIYALEDQNLLIKSPHPDGTTYKAVHPERLKLLFQKKENELEAQRQSLDALIAELKHTAQSSPKTYIEVKYGYDAHIDFMERSLETIDKLILEKWHMQNPIFQDPRYQKFIYKHVKKRVSKGVHLKYIVNSKYNNEFSSVMQSESKLLKEIRRNPPDADIKHSFRMYDEFIEIITFAESPTNNNKDEIMVIEIADRLVAELMRSMFWFIWQRSEEI